MVILISGASHTGKTVLAQRLLEKLHYPYLSIDHLKMGLIRSGNTNLTPCDDALLTEYLWPILRDIIKTAIENHQNLIVEGCYIPFNWSDSFTKFYRDEIKAFWLIMSEEYIEKHFEEICILENAIEQRLSGDSLSKEWLIEENMLNLKQCKRNGCSYILINDTYNVLDPALELLQLNG